MRAREAAEAIDRDLKAIAARAREADARRAELEKQYKLQVGLSVLEWCAVRPSASAAARVALVDADELPLHIFSILPQYRSKFFWVAICSL